MKTIDGRKVGSDSRGLGNELETLEQGYSQIYRLDAIMSQDLEDQNTWNPGRALDKSFMVIGELAFVHYSPINNH